MPETLLTTYIMESNQNWRHWVPYTHKYLRHTWIQGPEDDVEAPLEWRVPRSGLPPGILLSEDRLSVQLDSFGTHK